MKTTLLSLSLAFLLSFNCFGQKSEIESIVNAAVPLLVSENQTYFNLLDSGLTTEFDSQIMTQNEADKIKSEFPDFSYEEFLSLAKSDSTIVDWNEFEIKGAKIYAYENLPAFKNPTGNYHLVSADVSANEIAKFTQGVKPEDQTYLWISKPLISKSGFAMLTLNEGAKGATYLFKKIKGQWKNIYTFHQWSS